MRSDYMLYALAIIFFVITAASVFFLAGTEQILWTVASALLGILSLGLGFIQTPKPAQGSKSPTPAMTTSATQPEEVAIEPRKEEEKLQNQTATGTEVPLIKESEAPAQPAMLEAPAVTPVMLEAPSAQPAMLEPPAKIESLVETSKISTERALTEIRGIGDKRANQLKAIGIDSVDALARTSVKDLAETLKISPRIVNKWISGAKELQQK
jgi:predicted flap endonuclease-1-like 5' DNA nuclease